MAQTQCMANLMGGDKADELPHQFVSELHCACLRVYVGCLNHIPVVYQAHHVVVPSHMAFYDFATARVMNLRSVCIGDVGGKVSDNGKACVFQAHCGVVLRPLLGGNGILEACFLKSFVPVFDTLNQIGTPFFRCGWVDVIDDRLLGFHKFASFHLLYVFVFGLKAVSGYKAFELNTLLVIRKSIIVVCKVSYTWVKNAGAHGYLWQEDKRGVEAYGDSACYACRRDLTAAVVSAHGAYLGIDGVTVHTLNVACALNGVGGVESQFVALGNRKAVLR